MAEAVPPFIVDMRDGICVVRATVGKLKGPMAARLIELVFDEYDGDCVVLNLAAVEYTDSASVAALVRIASAKTTRVVGLRPPMEKLLEMMGVLNLMERAESEDAAVDELRLPPR